MSRLRLFGCTATAWQPRQGTAVGARPRPGVVTPSPPDATESPSLPPDGRVRLPKRRRAMEGGGVGTASMVSEPHVAGAPRKTAATACAHPRARATTGCELRTPTARHHAITKPARWLCGRHALVALAHAASDVQRCRIANRHIPAPAGVGGAGAALVYTVRRPAHGPYRGCTQRATANVPCWGLDGWAPGAALDVGARPPTLDALQGWIIGAVRPFTAAHSTVRPSHRPPDAAEGPDTAPSPHTTRNAHAAGLGTGPVASIMHGRGECRRGTRGRGVR